MMTLFQVCIGAFYPAYINDTVISELWEMLTVHLTPETDGIFLSRIFLVAQFMLMCIGSQAEFLLPVLPSFLLYSLDNPNEECRGRACSCLGLLCQYFPDV